MPYFLSAPRLWYASSRVCLLLAVFGLFPGERLRRPAWHPIKKIKNAALKTAIIQYRMLSGGFSGQRKGFAAWQ